MSEILHVEMRNVFKSYPQVNAPIEVLTGLNLKVHQGETLAIMGQSGSGKSTLLSLLAGLDQPTEGSVWLNGQEVSSMSEKELAAFRAKNLGIIFQQFHLMSNLSALENVSLPLELKRDPAHLAKAKSALAQVGLGHRENHLPSELSGGERQRVAIARAFVGKPALLLADEPSGSLDTKTGLAVMDLLFELTESEKMTLILVTHSESLAKRCMRGLSLNQGILS